MNEKIIEFLSNNLEKSMRTALFGIGKTEDSYYIVHNNYEKARLYSLYPNARNGVFRTLGDFEKI